MAKLQKLIGNIEINKDLLLLLTIGGLYSLSIALSNSFVNVYLWKQTGKLADLGVYNLSIVVMQPLTFILAGRWAKKIDRVIVLRLGVLFLSVFYILVLIIGSHANQFIVLMGAMLGIGYGFYWLAFNVLTFEITEPETRDFFNGFLGILTSSAGMIGPIAAGLVISFFAGNKGYNVIFAISLVLFACAVGMSFLLKRRPSHGQYVIKKVFQERKNDPNWKLITGAHFFQGLREGTFIFVIGVFVFITTGSELALGTFGMINSAVAFLAYYAASRIITKRVRKKAILLGGLLLYSSIFIILFKMSYLNLLIYAVCIAIAYPMLLVPYVSITYDVIGRAWNAAVARVEYIVVREIFLNAGRVVSLLGFIIVVSQLNVKTALPVFLAVIGAGHAFIYLFVRKIHLPEPSVSINKEDGELLAAESNLMDGENGT
ncbi:MFS transporter [Bacillus sp. FJAT-42376]|uniref:MFS transporter n=1 Tax=Bacillus sp. FJAT-42376 TaxID=2014076 RepID=UPI000F5120A4|nr:MFS transporter [Bacillus sp. FJAT-42376]AZB43634.1 MFS transporter [Bacillus sp. FJAT-42376]